MIIEILLWLIFIGSAIMLSVVILLQESKGGGLAEAFGGMGAQTFGVKASGINKFTTYVAIVFLVTAVLITCLRKGSTVFEPPAPVPGDVPGQQAPLEPGTGPGGGTGNTDGR
ncbi:MAG: preprotein translocase subunit SecG [Planctomycetota bacterium]|jgi:protein translocase SecG subunit